MLDGMILSDPFSKIIIRYRWTGCYMQQTACLVINPLTVNNCAALFNCMPVEGASDTMEAPAYNLLPLDSLSLVGPNGVHLLDFCFSVGLAVGYSSCSILLKLGLYVYYVGALVI